MILSEKRKNEKTGKTEYYCYVCGVWTKGRLWDGTGYTQVICDGCDLTLDNDYFGHKEFENLDSTGHGEQKGCPK